MESLRSAVRPLVWWILFSLLAIALVQATPQIALLLALLGGVAVGVNSVADYSSEQQHGAKERPGSGGEE